MFSNVLKNDSIETRLGFKYYISIACAIVILVSIQITLISKGFYAVSADESLHSINAYLWSRHLFHNNFVWLPFYRIFVGTFLFLFHDLMLVPRIISMVFGMLTLVMVTYFSHELFHIKIVSIITAFLCTIFVPVLVFSVVPLMGIMFFFFVIGAFSFFIKWLNNNKTSSLILTCVFLLLSDSVRYEGWVYSVSFFLILTFLIYKRDKTKIKISLILLIGFILSFFPFFWIISGFLETGKLLSFVGAVTSAYKPQGLMDNFSKNPLYQFLKLNYSSLNIAGFVTFIFLIRIDKRIKKFGLIFFTSLILMSFLAFFGKAMPSQNYWRISCSWSLLLLPFTSYLLYSFLKINFSVKYLNIGSFIVVTSILLLFFVRQDIEYTSNSYFTKSDLRTGKYVNHLLIKDKNDSKNQVKVLIVTYGWDFENVLVSSQQPAVFESVMNPLRKNMYITMNKNIQINYQLLRKNSIKYLVFPSLFDSYNKLDPRLLHLNTFGKWSIFKIQYKRI